jgi:hypothetical protein
MPTFTPTGQANPRSTAGLRVGGVERVAALAVRHDRDTAGNVLMRGHRLQMGGIDTRSNTTQMVQLPLRRDRTPLRLERPPVGEHVAPRIPKDAVSVEVDFGAPQPAGLRPTRAIDLRPEPLSRSRAHIIRRSMSALPGVVNGAQTVSEHELIAAIDGAHVPLLDGVQTSVLPESNVMGVAESASEVWPVATLNGAGSAAPGIQPNGRKLSRPPRDLVMGLTQTARVDVSRTSIHRAAHRCIVAF